MFVPDTYEGFEVKTFAELTDAELDRYLEANVAAVRELVEALGGVDAALANHLVMGPVILARAGLRYALKVHGSALSYTVLPDLERFGPYAEEGIDGRHRGAGRLGPHRRAPAPGGRRSRADAEGPPRPAGRRHRAVHPDGRAQAEARAGGCASWPASRLRRREASRSKG